MKPGGLALALGGFSLAAFGLIEVADDVETSDAIGLALSAIAFLTGVYVLAAGLLTYQGGVFETARFRIRIGGRRQRCGMGPPGCSIRAPACLSGLFRTVCSIRRSPASATTRSSRRLSGCRAASGRKKPFATSMWARLPWRLVSGALAFCGADAAGLCLRAGQRLLGDRRRGDRLARLGG